MPASAIGHSRSLGESLGVDPDRELLLQVLGDTVKRFGWICCALLDDESLPRRGVTAVTRSNLRRMGMLASGQRARDLVATQSSACSPCPKASMSRRSVLTKRRRATASSEDSLEKMRRSISARSEEIPRMRSFALSVG